MSLCVHVVLCASMHDWPIQSLVKAFLPEQRTVSMLWKHQALPTVCQGGRCSGSLGIFCMEPTCLVQELPRAWLQDNKV